MAKAVVTINGKVVPEDDTRAHLFNLGTRTSEVSATFFNSALSVFKDIEVDTENMTVKSPELMKVREWLASKNPDYVIHIDDDGQKGKMTIRETTVGAMLKKVDATIAALPFFRKMEKLVKEANGGIVLLGESEETGTKTRGSSKVFKSDFDID